MTNFDTNSIETINNRRSVRAYNNDVISKEILTELITFTENNAIGPFGNSIQFQIVDTHDFDTKSMKTLGTYGIIRGAQSYLVGIVNEREHCMEDFGFCMENSILKATSLGLGTCWLGGFLNRSTFADLCKISTDEIILAVTPLGFAAKRTTLRDKLIRKAVNSDNRHDFSTLFFSEDFTKPLVYDEAAPLHIVLECVRKAPSASNKQPWRIILSQNTFHLYLDEEVSYNNRFKPVLIQNIDMGIAMSHVALAAKSKGVNGKWTQSKSAPSSNKYSYISSWMPY